ncbi:MAG: hypothetical protein RL006_471, partial [Chloroflexota bacterium]
RVRLLGHINGENGHGARMTDGESGVSASVWPNNLIAPELQRCTAHDDLGLDAALSGDARRQQASQSLA